MTEKELIAVTIDRYTDLQRIKRANGDYKNPELDYLIKVTTANLCERQPAFLVPGSQYNSFSERTLFYL